MGKVRRKPPPEWGVMGESGREVPNIGWIDGFGQGRDTKPWLLVGTGLDWFGLGMD